MSLLRFLVWRTLCLLLHSPCLGVEPTRSTAQAARAKGLQIRELFFGRGTAAQLLEEGWAADLMAANNVLAHVPDINDFLCGFATLLKPTGVATFEFPQLLTLMAGQTPAEQVHDLGFELMLREST